MKNGEEKPTMGGVVPKYHYKFKSLSSFKKDGFERVEKSLLSSFEISVITRAESRFSDPSKKQFDFFESGVYNFQNEYKDFLKRR